MQVSQVFAAKTVYFAALLGGILGYFGFVALVALSVLIGSGQIGEAFNVFAMGLIVGTIPAALASAFIVAPIGLVIAVKALGWLPQNRWPGAFTGALTGVLTAIVLIIALAAVLRGEWRETMDLGTVAFLVAALVIAAMTGWFTQRHFLRQPIAR